MLDIDRKLCIVHSSNLNHMTKNWLNAWWLLMLIWQYSKTDAEIQIATVPVEQTTLPVDVVFWLLCVWSDTYDKAKHNLLCDCM